MEDSEKREYYKNEIVKMIDNLENIQLIEYFYYFISGKIKAGQ